MNLYAKYVFPRLCDLFLGRPFVNAFRRKLLASARGNILEIGFGTGLNLPCYPDPVHQITAIDPSAGMHLLAEKRIKATGIEVDHRLLSGERLPFEANTFDCVVSTFTLCSVDDVNQALAEVYRVLNPGGLFLFLEHGLCPEPKVHKWQRRLNWLEKCLADGCRLDRDMRALVAMQPFSSIQIENAYLEKSPRTHGYLYIGCAVK